MASFQILSPLRPYFNQQGQIAAGGNLKFYEAGTTTLRSVYGDRALTVNNGSTVTLDAAGYPTAEIWGDAALAYKVRLYDVDNVLQDEQDWIEVDGDTFPTGTDGQFLGLSGGNPTYQTIRQVPDPTGHANKFLTTDGTTLSFAEINAGVKGVVTHQTVTAAATTNIDLSLGLSVKLDQAVSITTLTFSNVPAGAGVLSIRRVKDATATARTIAWPASVKWPGGVAPTLTSTSGAIDEIALKFADGIFTGTSRLAFA